MWIAAQPKSIVMKSTEAVANTAMYDRRRPRARKYQLKPPPTAGTSPRSATICSPGAYRAVTQRQDRQHGHSHAQENAGGDRHDVTGGHFGPLDPCLEKPARQDRQRRIGRQDVMRQLRAARRPEAEEDADPADEEHVGRQVLAAGAERAIGVDDRRPQEDRPGKQSDQHDDEVIVERTAVAQERLDEGAQVVLGDELLRATGHGSSR